MSLVYYLPVRIFLSCVEVSRRISYALTLLLLSPRAMVRLQLALARKQARFWLRSEMNQGYLDPVEELLIERSVLDHFSTPADVLDLYCGGGRSVWIFAKRGFSVLGLDGVPQIIAQNRVSFREQEAIRFDVAELPFAFRTRTKGESFQIVLALNGMFSTIPGQRQRADFLETVAARLSKGGRAIVSAIGSPAQPSRILKWKGFFRLLGGNSQLEAGDRFQGEFVHHFASADDLRGEIDRVGDLRCLSIEGTAIGARDVRYYALLEKL